MASRAGADVPVERPKVTSTWLVSCERIVAYENV